MLQRAGRWDIRAERPSFADFVFPQEWADMAISALTSLTVFETAEVHLKHNVAMAD